MLHFLLHGFHHYLPMDKYRLVMPPSLFIILAAPFWKLAHAVFFYNRYVSAAILSPKQIKRLIGSLAFCSRVIRLGD